MDKPFVIRDITDKDLDDIASLYNYYILNTVITFEEHPITANDFSERVKNVINQGQFWLVAECDSGVVGYAYTSQWNNRCAYKHTVESSVYIDHQFQGLGVGTCLYKEMFHRLKQSSAHTLISGIALPNAASIKLHENFGMKKVAHFQQTGYKFKQWIDVGYWQILFQKK